jgi:CheY-like chemotaxis protein
LLADDSIDNRNLIAAYLQKLPYRLDHAEDGEIAFARFIAGKYDLVLMDMLMPVLDGYRAVRNIRVWERAHGRAPTPIAALTASALEEDVRRTIEAGCTSHLSKPIKKSRLLQAILDLSKVPLSSLDNPPGELVDAQTLTGPEFLERKRRDVYAMTAALERSDYHAVRSIARRTKGEGVSLGFESISDIGDALEEAAHRRDVAEVSRQVRALSDCLNRIEVRAGEEPRA